MKTEAKERPIIFSTPMVQALLDGRKTQTRRIVKAPYQGSCDVLADKDYPYMTHNPSKDNFHFILIHGDILSTKCPHGSPGDILYVKETFASYPNDFTFTWNYKYVYKADLKPAYAERIKWTPSIFMPKEASRIKLLIKDRWIERLNDISRDDAIAEGIEREGKGWKSYAINHKRSDALLTTTPNITPMKSYRELWESLYGPDSWSKNPWVWVIDFKVL